MVWPVARPAQLKKTSRGIGLSFILARTHLINREWARCQRFHAAARPEEGEYPSWIFDRRATLAQRQRSATLRAKLWQAPGGVAPQSQNASAMLLRRALPAARQSLAHSFPLYEMGSKDAQVQSTLPSAQAPVHSLTPGRAFVERIRFAPPRRSSMMTTL